MKTQKKTRNDDDYYYYYYYYYDDNDDNNNNNKHYYEVDDDNYDGDVSFDISFFVFRFICNIQRITVDGLLSPTCMN